MLAGLRQLGPELKARGVLEPTPLGDFDPQDTCGALEGAILIPMAIAAGRWMALVAAAAQDFRLLPFSRLLYHPLSGKLHERTQEFLAMRRLGLALQEGREILGLQCTWRYLLWHMGVLLLLRRVIRHTRTTLPEERLPPYHFDREYRP
jgi:hypothetical protein